VSDPTSVAAVADTIVRTVELGVTITDAAVDGDATVVFCICSMMASAAVQAVGLKASAATP
jgi:hypothetical protein